MGWLSISLLLLSGLGLGVNIHTTIKIKDTFDTKLSLYQTLWLDAGVTSILYGGLLIISFGLTFGLHLGMIGCISLASTAGLFLFTLPVASFSISFIRYNITKF